MTSRSDAQDGRSLPVNLPVERAVLGAVIESEVILSASLDAGLSEHDFSLSDHRRVFAAILSLRQKSAPVDYLAVAEELGSDPMDIALIADLIHGVVIVPSHAAHHVRIVRKKSALRKLAKIGDWLSAAACQVGAEPASLQKELTQRLSGLEDHA